MSGLISTFLVSASIVTLLCQAVDLFLARVLKYEIDLVNVYLFSIFLLPLGPILYVTIEGRLGYSGNLYYYCSMTGSRTDTADTAWDIKYQTLYDQLAAISLCITTLTAWIIIKLVLNSASKQVGTTEYSQECSSKRVDFVINLSCLIVFTIVYDSILWGLFFSRDTILEGNDVTADWYGCVLQNYRGDDVAVVGICGETPKRNLSTVFVGFISVLLQGQAIIMACTLFCTLFITKVDRKVTQEPTSADTNASFKSVIIDHQNDSSVAF